MKKKSWIVHTRCMVERDIFCSDCTEAEAGDNPYKYCIDEVDTDLIDLEVISIEPND